ncbi:hypothetical protein [Blastopirellula retiformator]|uniref:Uncharacterized protein n=1 Tax=Blastopirellula retiformator TaxID=2527970 RepID=A0A5C5VNV6_9BACT|nr:hypothetical protein [Blastopirellula retiformator]TWT39551.1 hypothetical protein Enr8_12510 [Blastopirellula retiformator]
MQEIGGGPPVVPWKRRWTLLVALVLAFAAFNFIMTGLWHLSDGREMAFPHGAYVGLFVVQIDLVAFWTALGTGRIIVRLPWALLAITLAYVMHQSGAKVFLRYDVSLDQQMLLAAILLFGWLAATLGLAAYRVVTRRCLVLQGTTAESSRKFYLHHLIVGTALCSMTLAVLNAFGYPVTRVRHVEPQLLFALCFAAAINLVTIVPATALAFRLWKIWPSRWFVLAGICGVLTLVEMFTFCAVLGMPPSFPRALVFLALANFGQGFGLLGALLLLRTAGYQLQTVDGLRKEIKPTDEAQPATVDADPWTDDD